MPLHIGVLCSEPPTEGDDTAALDGRSAQDLAESIRRLGHRATVIPADDELSLALALRREVLDGCLLATHGDLGGSGRLQAQLRRCCLPHVGPSAAAVTLAYDKLRARDRLSRCNLPVPTSLAFGAGLQTPRRELAYLGWPAILKPRRGSLGRGVLRLESAQEIADLVDDELAHGGEILVERALGLGPDTKVNPSGGALAGNPLMAVGLSRIGECATRIWSGEADRAVAHATSGPCLQQNLVCVLEGE